MSILTRLFPRNPSEPIVRIDPPMSLPPRTVRYRYSTFNRDGTGSRREIEIEEGNCEFVSVAVGQSKSVV